jgi:hypothetical protein
MINIAREPEEGTLGFLQRLFVGLTLWFTLPITLFIFALKFIKKHEEYLSYIIVGLAFFSIYIVIWFWNSIINKRDECKKDLFDFTVTNIATILFILSIGILVPAINEGDFKWANLDLRNELLVTVPDKEKDFEGVYWADLEGVNLNGADLTSVVLKRANLKDAKLNKATLFKANLEKAALEDANLQEADLFVANLAGAYGLNKKELCEAGTLYETDIDEDLLKQTQGDKECAYKLTQESYDKWLEEQRKKRQEKAEEDNKSKSSESE